MGIHELGLKSSGLPIPVWPSYILMTKIKKEKGTERQFLTTPKTGAGIQFPRVQRKKK